MQNLVNRRCTRQELKVRRFPPRTKTVRGWNYSAICGRNCVAALILNLRAVLWISASAAEPLLDPMARQLEWMIAAAVTQILNAISCYWANPGHFMNRSWRDRAEQVTRVCIIMHDELGATLSLCPGAVTDVLGLSVINNAGRRLNVRGGGRGFVYQKWSGLISFF